MRVQPSGVGRLFAAFIVPRECGRARAGQSLAARCIVRRRRVADRACGARASADGNVIARRASQADTRSCDPHRNLAD
jgi:hypothetical protein